MHKNNRLVLLIIANKGIELAMYTYTNIKHYIPVELVDVLGVSPGTELQRSPEQQQL